jgi:hypothetical protein
LRVDATVYDGVADLVMKMVGLRVVAMALCAVLRLDNELADVKAVSMADEKADAVVVLMALT